jgi:hypothetical protein
MRAYSTRSAPALQRNADLPDRDGRIDPSNPIHDVTQRPPHRRAFRHAHPLLARSRREAQRSLTAKPGSPRLADRVRGYRGGLRMGGKVLGDAKGIGRFKVPIRHSGVLGRDVGI